jgi:hypothetical protein
MMNAVTRTLMKGFDGGPTKLDKKVSSLDTIKPTEINIDWIPAWSNPRSLRRWPGG